MVDPTLDAGIQFAGADLAGMIGGEPHPQPAVGGADLARLDQPVRRMNDEAEPGNAGAHRQHLRPALVDDETQTRQPLDYRRLPRPQLGLVVAEQGKVVDIAQVGMAAEFPRHELVERMEITVGPELRGEVADR